TGNLFPQLGLIGSYAPGGGEVSLLAKLDQVVTELGFTAYTADTSNRLNMFLFTLSLMIGTAGLPHVIIRFFTVPKVADARASAGWALVFIAMLYTVAPAVGSMARLNLTTTMWPSAITANATDGQAIARADIDSRPELSWIRTWEQTGLMDIQDKNGDGFIQYYNDAAPADHPISKLAAERGWKGNELVKVDNDIMVLANPEIAALPAWVIALVAAGALAAALSTAAGLLLAISSAISHDLIKGSLKPDLSEKDELMVARIAMTFAIIVATWLGLNPPGFAAQVVALAFGLAAATIFPALMLGIFFKRINKEGAMSGMLVGLIFTAAYIFVYKGWFFIPGTNNLPDTPDNYVFGISPLSIGAIGALINFLVAFVVSSVTKAP